MAAHIGTNGLFAEETFRDCNDCPEMVVVPAGSFMMGTTEAAGQLALQRGFVQYAPPLEWEKPRHQVRKSPSRLRWADTR